MEKWTEVVGMVFDRLAVIDKMLTREKGALHAYKFALPSNYDEYLKLLLGVYNCANYELTKNDPYNIAHKGQAEVTHVQAALNKQLEEDIQLLKEALEDSEKDHEVTKRELAQRNKTINLLTEQLKEARKGS